MRDDTPAASRRRARCWRWVAIAALAAYIPLRLVRFPLDGPVGGLALLAVVESVDGYGWARGWEARDRTDREAADA